MCIWCMQCLRAHARMYCAKKRRKKKLLTLCMWRRLHRGGAEAFDSNAHAQTALIISQCLHWKRNPRVLWFFFCSSDIVFARRSASYIVFYYRYGCCLPVCTTLLPSRKMYRNIRNASLQTPSPVVKYVWQTVQLLPEPPWLPDLAGAPPPGESSLLSGPVDTQDGVVESATCCIWIPSMLCSMKLDEMPRGKKWLRNSFKKRKTVFLSGEKILFFFFFSLEKESHPTLPQASSARWTHTVCLTTETWLAHSFRALFALVHI